MKWETKKRGRELPGMEALSFTVLVAHNGVGVVAADCGGRRWFSFFSPLLRCAVFFLCFLFPLSTVFLPLCSGFVVVLLVQVVAAKRKTGGGLRRTLLRLLCIFFFFLLPSVCASFTLLSLSLLDFLSFPYSPLFPSLSFFLFFPHWFFSSSSPPCFF
jgi:hypothetical protein